MPVYTLFGQPSNPATLASDTQDYTLGIEFAVSRPNGTLTAIWFNSASGAANLPDHIGLYVVSGQVLNFSQAASWSGAAGSGQVRAPVTSPPVLTASANYRAFVSRINGNSGNWYSDTAAYFTTGAGSGGVTSGPLSAPNNASSDVGQDSFNHGSSIAYPGSSGSGGNYWIDVEVTYLSGSELLMASII